VSDTAASGSLPRFIRLWRDDGPHRYALAVVAIGVAFLLQMILAWDLEPPYLFFFPAVLLIGALGGFGPGALATLLAAVLTVLWVLPAERQSRSTGVRELVGLALFVLMGLLASAVAHRVHTSRRRVVTRGEEALHLSDRRYRILADNANDVIWTFDLRTRRFSYISPSISRLRGLSVEEALVEPLERRLTPESLGRVQALLALIGTPEERDSVTAVYDQPCRDGSIRHVEITTSLVRDPSGRAVEVVGVSRDATERVRAERALEVRERHLQTILETALDGFWIVDGNGRLLQVNGAACTLSGYSREEMVTMQVSDLEAGESVAEVADHVRRIRERGWDRFESRHRRKDGRLVDVESRVQCSGAEGEMVVFLRDITEAKRSRLALERSEERFRALIEQSTDMIMLFDASAICTFWSPSAVETLGWTPDEILDHSALELVHPDDLARAATLLEKVVSRPGVVMREVLRIRHRDGSCRQVEATARNLLHDAAVHGVVLNGRDVTNQRLLEEQFWQSQKLESVGRLAGGVAHDFNNLLTVILSGVEELREPEESVPPSSLEIVGEIGAAAERGRDLTRQLLAFARKQVVAPVTIDLGGVVRGSDKLLRRLLGEDVDLISILAPDLWPIRSDPGQVGQVLLNLAVNASDAMPDGGRLTVETSNLEVGQSGLAGHPGMQPGPYVRLRVSDTGTGMPPEVKSRLFEPFFTTKAVGRGTGLGLATVYGIVKQSDGFISVESELGVGTTFSVYFPRIRGAVAEVAPRA
jgi:PAS domain S-box-containing protein